MMFQKSVAFGLNVFLKHFGKFEVCNSTPLNDHKVEIGVEYALTNHCL